MSIGIFFYREFITNILFGKQWSEASDIVGAWALMMVISVVVYSFPAEAYKARGIPKILFLYQMCYLVFLIPICMYTAKIDFWTFVYARTASIFEQAILCIIFIKIFLKWDIKLFLKNLITPSIASLSVVLVCVLCKKVVPDTLGGNFVSIMGIVIIYFVVLCIFFKQDIMKSIMTIQRKKL